LTVKTAIRIISLKDSNRREIFHQPSPSLGLDPQFVDASTGLIDDLSYDPARSYLNCRRELVRQEIGCYASHVSLWRELIGSTDVRQMLVLEDDVYVDWPIVAEICAIDWSVHKIDYLKLMSKYPAQFTVRHWSYPLRDRHIVRYRSLALGTGAYLISVAAATVLEKQSKVISRPIDVQMDRPWGTGLPVFGIVPAPVLEATLPSSIVGRDRGSESVLQRSRYFAGRIVEHSRAYAYRLR
jgi:glycosyl transferase family 25